MRYFLFFSIFLLLFFKLDAKNKKTEQNETQVNKVEMLDSQYLKLYNSIQEINSKLKFENETFWEKYTSSFATLIVGILALLANIGIHISLKKSNERVHKTQIDNSFEIAMKQIRHSQNLAIMEYNGELMAKNRQEWSNTFRIQISEFATNSSMYYLEVKNKDELKKKIIFEKIQLNINLLKLLLNPEYELHKEVLIKITSVSSYLTNDTMKPEIHSNNTLALIEASRKLLYKEWGKIQELAKSI